MAAPLFALTMPNAPIALFVYNRPEHTRQTLLALAENYGAQDSDLFIFSDAPTDAASAIGVGQVRQLLREIEGFASVTIVEREQNFGLARSIIDGVGSLCERFGRVIVLEDDLQTSPHFLRFMNEALEVWQQDERVQSVCGYMYPVPMLPSIQTFFLPAPHSWGWATWLNRWSEFREDGGVLLQELTSKGLLQAFDATGPHSYVKMLRDQIGGRNNSWFIRWYASGFLQQRYSLYPARSLVRNIGIDGTGVHCADWMIDPFDVDLVDAPITVKRVEVRTERFILALLGKYYRRIRLVRYVNFILRKLMPFRQKQGR